MIITLEEAKSYLRVDSKDEDALLLTLIATAEDICSNILRVSFDELNEVTETIHTSILYAVSYLYENREKADFGDLMIVLRSLLFGERKDVF